MALNSLLLADLPYNLSKLQTGYLDSVQATTANMYYLAIVSGQTKLADLASDYAKSFANTSPTTVLAYRDFCISQAISYSLQSVMYTDPSKIQLTGCVDKALTKYGLNTLFYPDIGVNTTYTLASRYAGLLGTVAYYFLYVEAAGYPLDIYNELLTFIWEINGTDYNQPPKVRIQTLLNLLETSSENDLIVSNAITNLFTNVTSSSDPLYPILTYARRSYLTIADGQDFTQNVLAGTYPMGLLTVLSQLLPEQEYRIIANYADSLLTVCVPVGFPLLVQAIIVESFIKIAEILTALPSEIANMPLAEFLQTPSTSVTISELLSLLYTAYDAEYYLTNKVGIAFPPTQDLPSLILPWSNGVVNPTGRLSNLVNPPSPLGAAQVLYDPALNQVQKIVASGTQVYGLTASHLAGNPIVYVATNYTGLVPPNIIFVSSTPSGAVTLNNVQVGTANANTPTLITNQPRNNLGVTRAAVTNNTSNPLVAIAISPNSNLSTGSVVTPSQIAYLVQDGNVSYSSAIVTTPSYVPTNTLAIAYDVMNQQINNYVIYNNLTTTSLPSGGINDSYAVLALNYSSITPEQSLKYAQGMWLGAFQEFAGRMCDLNKQVSNVHLAHEIQTLDNYLNNLTLLTGISPTNLTLGNLPSQGTINSGNFTPPPDGLLSTGQTNITNTG